MDDPTVAIIVAVVTALLGQKGLAYASGRYTAWRAAPAPCPPNQPPWTAATGEHGLVTHAACNARHLRLEEVQTKSEDKLDKMRDDLAKIREHLAGLNGNIATAVSAGVTEAMDRHTKAMDRHVDTLHGG